MGGCEVNYYDEPPLGWCCQGAEECTGLRYNAESDQCEFILYANVDHAVWCASKGCPLCGDTWIEPGIMPPVPEGTLDRLNAALCNAKRVRLRLEAELRKAGVDPATISIDLPRE